MTVHELTPEDLNQLRTAPTPPQGVTLLHYFHSHRPTAPALCGEQPQGGSWEHHYRPGATAFTAGGKLAPQFELCPLCQVRYSYLPTARPVGGGAQ